MNTRDTVAVAKRDTTQEVRNCLADISECTQAELVMRSLAREFAAALVNGQALSTAPS